jgi:3-oxoacyl-(acyl-carrier-protein) synthase/SAM-dependent methyltransferase/aryl carrier-like protein
LPAILSGAADPLDALFPEGEPGLAAAVYGAAPFAAPQRALAEAIGRFARGRPLLRVLELGGGTGALTAQVLPLLPAGSELLFTDVSPAFLAAARRRFAGHPALHTALFDLDRPDDGPGGPFDAILAANVLHAGADLGRILEALRARLTPGGVLGLVELVRAPRWIELVFGVTEGWWRFRGDPLRPDHALLDAESWRAALERHGFTEIGLHPDGEAHAVLLARTADEPRRWRLAGSGVPAGLAERVQAGESAEVLYCPGRDKPAALVEELGALADGGARLSVVTGLGVAHAAVAGAARALSLDHPDAIAATFELHDHSAASLTALAAALGRTGVEDQFRLRDGRLEVARLARATAPAGPPPRLRQDALYVVAGGLGHLGAACTRWLITQGARHLLLVGRSSADPARVAALAGDGASIRTLRLDLTESGAAARLAAAIDRPLGGLVHAAGIATGPAAEVIAAKLGIAAALEQAAIGHAPDFALLFSSAAGIWGARDRLAYAAANRALDRWAEEARERGFPATSIAFGRFAEPGLLSPEEDAALAAAGLEGLAPSDAFAAAFRVAAAGLAHRVLAAVRWDRFRETYAARRRRPLLDRLAPPPRPRPASKAEAVAASAAVPGPLTRDRLAVILAEVLGQADAGRIDPDRGLFEQGLDSLMTIALRRRLEEATGIPVPAAVLFAQPTLTMLADWLAGQARDVPLPAVATRSDDAVAVIGIGCRFPEGADDPERFLAMLMAGGDVVREVPPERWALAEWYDPDPAAAGKIATRWGGFLDGVDQFDAAFFGISPREAAQIDPQQRLLLEVAWEALEHAGVAADRLAGSRTGVFIGATGSDYAALARAAGAAALDAHGLIGQPNNTLAGRLAYQFGLHGPALTVDTACSSSLVAVHLGLRSLRAGEAEMALVGGVNLLLAPESSVVLSRAGLMSPTGRCRAFDAAADGYVRGEGCGLLLLKPLLRAEADGDRVLAVIRGSAVNHDGRSSSFTAPNGAAQVAVIRAALADAGLAPADIDYVEAHGTGTALGDPIEFDALAEVFAGRERPLALGSVKANLGHTEAAAGVAGLIKAVLALGTGRLPPQIHFERLNPQVAGTAVPLRLPTEPMALPPGICRAGVSAFGASGTNAHVVLEAAAPVKPSVRGEGGPRRLLLSAATPDALAALSGRLRDHLAASRASFADVCHTAAIGRSRLRWWLVAEDAAALATAVPSDAPPPVLPLPDGKRVALPTYPFQRRRHWLEARGGGGRTAARASAPLGALGRGGAGGPAILQPALAAGPSGGRCGAAARHGLHRSGPGGGRERAARAGVPPSTGGAAGRRSSATDTRYRRWYQSPC